MNGYALPDIMIPIKKRHTVQQIQKKKKTLFFVKVYKTLKQN